MGNSIKNLNVDELLSSYIDNEIHESVLRNKVQELINTDPVLSKKYNSELLTKNLLRTRIKNVDVPLPSKTRIGNSIDDLIKAAAYNRRMNFVAKETFFERFKAKLIQPLFSRLPVPRYAFAMILILSMLLTVLFAVNQDSSDQLNPYIVNGTEKSIMVQAVKNFAGLMSGEIRPQIETNDVHSIRNYVQTNSQIDPYIPAINGFDLVGCVCDEYAGEKITHLVYRNGEDLIYIYEVPVNALQKQSLQIPEQVSSQIISEKYYMCDNVSNEECTLLMWYYEGKVCATVSNMPKQNLLEKFASLR